MKRKTLKQALLAAADWLDANPDKHIAGNLAISKDGNYVVPTSRRAQCFCGVGRVCRELGINDSHRINRMSDYLSVTPSGDNITTRIIDVNDNVRGKRKLICDLTEPGNRAVIRTLRSIAKKLP